MLTTVASVDMVMVRQLRAVSINLAVSASHPGTIHVAPTVCTVIGLLLGHVGQ